MAVDAAGIVWFAATSDRAIGRLDPATGEVTLTPTETLVPRALTIAADGDVWFSARFVPQGVGELGPQDIAGSPDGSVWFTQTTEGNIARIMDSGVVTEGKVVKNSEPFGITVAPNGDPWYAMLEANKFARLKQR